MFPPIYFNSIIHNFSQLCVTDNVFLYFRNLFLNTITETSLFTWCCDSPTPQTLLWKRSLFNLDRLRAYAKMGNTIYYLLSTETFFLVQFHTTYLPCNYLLYLLF